MNCYLKLKHACWHHKSIGLALFVAILALAAYPAGRVWAAAGDLDTSFSGDGRYTVPFAFPASNSGYARSVDDILIQPDPNNVLVERVIAAYPDRLVCFASNYDFLVTRLTSSGTKDNTFGTNGVASINFDGTGLPTQSGTVTALALQSNGKILVAGTLCASGVSVAALARLTVDGVLDTSFSDDGLWFFFGVSEVSDMIVQPDGKILLTGRMKDSTGMYWQSAMWRFNSNGATDSSFGIQNGYMRTTVWSGSATDGGVREGFKTAYVQTDGKIVVLNNNGSGYRLRRFTASGTPDSSLQVNASTGNSGNSIRSVGSNIWVIGSSGEYGAIFARNSTNGLLDASFGNLGKVVSSQPSVWTASAPMPTFIGPAKYVVVGWNKYDLNPTSLASKGVIMRYFASGALDTGFGTNGITETADFDSLFGGSMPSARFFAVKIGLSGKIVTSGVIGSFVLPPLEFGGVARYWGN